MREEHDPIEQVKRRLVAEGHFNEEDLKKIDSEMRAIVTDAAEFAQSDPEPDPSELWTDIYKSA
jgi:pyruvate dehydrogenase E1 component alpha subunit